MARQPLHVRDAGPGDVDALARLWTEAGHPVSQPPDLVQGAPQALAHIAAAADERLVVGELDGEVVAAMHLRRAPISPLHSEQVVHTSYLLVQPEHRRHGHAHALLEYAVAWAEEKDIGHVSAVTISNAREINRFLARLGLGTVATIRLAPTTSLRKKLSPAPPKTVGGHNIGQVLAARRSMRRRQSLS